MLTQTENAAQRDLFPDFDPNQAPLGTLAKSAAKIAKTIDQNTGEVVDFEMVFSKNSEISFVEANVDHQDFALRQRFRLQGASFEILRGVLNPNGKPFRVNSCLRNMTGSDVQVMHSPEFSTNSYAGLQTCGSPWICPCCSSKVCSRRSAEISAALSVHTAAGGTAFMVTFTWAHGRNDDLSSMIKNSSAAMSAFRAHRTYKQMVKRLGYIGVIRALEVKYGDANGWHPHFHDLWLCSREVSQQEIDLIQKNLFDLWSKYCVKHGLGRPSEEHGVLITRTYSADEYLTKFGRDQNWGAGREMTHANTKKGHDLKRLTPWDFLHLHANGDTSKDYLFQDYASAMFGARQLYWSKGLKKLFGIDDLTDEEIAGAQHVDSVVVCRINKEQWKIILKQDSRAHILSLAASLTPIQLQNYIDNLVKNDKFKPQKIVVSKAFYDVIFNIFDARCTEFEKFGFEFPAIAALQTLTPDIFVFQPFEFVTQSNIFSPNRLCGSFYTSIAQLVAAAVRRSCVLFPPILVFDSRLRDDIQRDISRRTALF